MAALASQSTLVLNFCYRYLFPSRAANTRAKSPFQAINSLVLCEQYKRSARMSFGFRDGVDFDFDFDFRRSKPRCCGRVAVRPRLFERQSPCSFVFKAAAVLWSLAASNQNVWGKWR